MENWVVIRTAIYPQDIYLAQSLLESEEIDTFIKDELTAQIINFYSTAIGGVKLMVRQNDVQRALDLLTRGGYIAPAECKAGVDPASDSDPVSASDPDPASYPASDSKAPSPVESIRTADRTRCPWCGSEQISKIGKADSTAVAVTYFFSLPLPFLNRTRYCWDCGRRWKFKW